ncbi:MAG: DUF1573 domain-containing protein [Weeksellaceae bacterium]|nr:DUF1573 domain-containing protein [Weeksellaceae bacterium]
MKKLLLLGVFSLIGFVGLQAQEISFEKDEIQYGEIAQGANGERVFKFTNTGTAPLIITNVTSTCGCTVPAYPTDPILPNQTGEIKVKYDTKRIGAFNKAIDIQSNAVTNSRKIIRIKGTVLKPAGA